MISLCFGGFSGYFGFLPQSKDVCCRLIRISVLCVACDEGLVCAPSPLLHRELQVPYTNLCMISATEMDEYNNSFILQQI